jgi:hypothetical protein
MLELAGATLVIGLLVTTTVGTPPLSARTGLVQVIPFLVTAFAAFWLRPAGSSRLGLRFDMSESAHDERS